AVLQDRQQLPAMYLASAVNEKFCDWSADLRRNGRLVQGKQDGLCRDRPVERDLLHNCGLHRNRRFRLLFLGTTDHRAYHDERRDLRDRNWTLHLSPAYKN